MKNIKRSLLSVLLILVLLVSTVFTSYAYEARSTITKYSKEYNSGTRGDVCTTLDGTSAATYYSAGYSYDTLSNLSSSSLFNSLQTLMRSTHSYTSSYNDCHYKADRTDCENEKGDILLLYTSYSATMSQWNGWNREHVWPQSLGGGNTTGGGADLHHIRPSDAGVNSSRGNKKYGESGSGATEKYGTNPAVGYLGGTYNSTYFEPNDDVKGDVARICLYVYVRWNSSWGADSITDVFQSIDVLLEWCALDPVDTWEMGRNEVVQDIQGNRNVFIDYPEYAWLLFGRDVPDDLVSPSGNNGGSTGGDSSEGGDDIVTPEPPVANSPIVVESPAVNTAYKFGMLQGNLNETYYVTGDMDGYYMATTTDYNSGIDVYLEQTSGGYYLYTKSGSTKKYINMVVSSDGAHVNGAYETTASTVYTFDQSLGSVVATVDGDVYHFGTRNDKQYSTVGPCKTSYNGFGCQFYEMESIGDSDCPHTNTKTITISATCTTNGKTTVICNDCSITVSTTTITASGHTLVDSVCVKCGHAETITPTPSGNGGWNLVNNASELKAGDQIVIVSGNYVAGNLSSNYLSQVSGVTTSGETITSLPSGAMIFTLGGSSSAWTLTNQNNQKLGATTVKKLSLTGGTTTWTISISNGKATIQNTNSSYGRFLYNVSSPRFTTYTSNTSVSMLLPEIYKYTEAPAKSDIKISAASLTMGSSLAMNYYVSGYEEGVDYYMVFTMNGKDSERINGTVKNGYLVFSFTNIPPHFMGENISASLYSSKSTPETTLASFSIKAYAEKVIEKYNNDEELMDLIADMLRYGAAAQTYVGYNTSNLVTSGINLGTSGSGLLPTDADNDRSFSPMADVTTLSNSFTAVGVRFDYDNKIFVKFKTNDITKIKIAVNDTEITAESFIANADGTYVFYTEGILATGFDEIYTFEMYVNGTLYQTVTYSVNSYAYAKCGDLTVTDESALTPIAQLVRALYRYGASANAYIK